MTLPELLLKLRGEDIFPIRVEAIPERSNDLVFIGALGEFIEAAKAIQSPVVFVSTVTLSEDHFLWNNPDTDDESDVDVRIDLCRVVPPLKEFKSRVGEDGNIDLSVPGPKCSLTLAIVEDWFAAFVELHSQALQLLRQAHTKRSDRGSQNTTSSEKSSWLNYRQGLCPASNSASHACVCP